jgi:hypothetical protein
VAPSSRRKHYASQSGFCYEYWYEGHRSYRSRTDSGTGFVFRILTADETASVTVFLSAGVLRAWEQRHGREFSAAERYAIAKMALFQAFDERAGPADMVEAVNVSGADLDTIAESLNME